MPLDWPRLSGSQLGNTVTLSVQSSFDTGSFLDATSVRYQWLRCAPATPWDAAGQCAAIGGATATTYAVQPADAGFVVRVRAKGRNSAGNAPPVYSGTTPVVAAPENTVLPSATGDVVAGATLVAQPGTWTGWPASTYDYLWRSSVDGATWSSPGVHAREYTVGAGDRYVRVEVTATNAAGSSPLVYSPVLTVVVPPANTVLPAISGTPTVGSTLTAGTGTWTGSPSSYAYEWRRCDAGGSSCTPIGGAAAASYAVAAADLGATIRVAVTATNPGGFSGAGGLGRHGCRDRGLDRRWRLDRRLWWLHRRRWLLLLRRWWWRRRWWRRRRRERLSRPARRRDRRSDGGAPGGRDGDLPRDRLEQAEHGSRVGGIRGRHAPGRLRRHADDLRPRQRLQRRRPGLVCSLDWIAPGIDGHVTIVGTVGTAGAQTISAHARHAILEADPSDDTGTLTLSALAPAATPPSTPVGTAGPSIRLLKAAAAKTGRVAVRVTISGWTINASRLDGAGSASGYWLIWVDGKRSAISRLPVKGLTKALAPGRHRIQVELVRENGTPVSPRLLSKPVAVKVPLRPWIHVAKTVRAKSGKVVVWAQIKGWKINRHALAVARVERASRVSGYWAVIVDGKRTAVSRLARKAVLRRLAPGRHTIRLELLREDGSRIAPRARSAPVRIGIPKRTSAGHAGGET